MEPESQNQQADPMKSKAEETGAANLATVPPAYSPESSQPEGQAGAYAGQPGAYAGQPGAYAGQPGAYAGQPGATQPSYGQPLQPGQQQVLLVNRPTVNQWAHGLCGCFDNVGLCCMAFWCPCIVFGRNAEHLGKDCVLWGALFTAAAIVGAPWILGMIMRSELRRKHALVGDDCNDCLVWFCCGLCALTQEAAEIKRAQNQPNVMVIDRE